MTELRRKMIEDMRLAGLSEETQRVYVRNIYRLAAFYMRSPDLLSEEEVAAYLRQLIEIRKVARGTFQTARSAIQFLFGNTLARAWPLLKKRCGCLLRSACP
jgi:integrase/recombinase XerD